MDTLGLLIHLLFKKPGVVMIAWRDQKSNLFLKYKQKNEQTGFLVNREKWIEQYMYRKEKA